MKVRRFPPAVVTVKLGAAEVTSTAAIVPVTISVEGTAGAVATALGVGVDDVGATALGVGVDDVGAAAVDGVVEEPPVEAED